MSYILFFSRIALMREGGKGNSFSLLIIKIALFFYSISLDPDHSTEEGGAEEGGAKENTNQMQQKKN